MHRNFSVETSALAGTGTRQVVSPKPTPAHHISLPSVPPGTARDLSKAEDVAAYIEEQQRRVFEEMQSLDLAKVTAKFERCFDHIAKYVVAFESIIAQSKLALLTGNHHLLIGPPGTGKTMYSRALRGIMGGEINTFAAQLTAEMTEEALYGYIPIPRIEDGSGCRNLAGGLALSVFACIDETFDARDELLRSTLWPLSDRLYRNGNSLVTSTLHSVLACGNYKRYNEKTEAFLDRFLFQSELGRVDSPLLRQKILRSFQTHHKFPDLPAEERLSQAELRYCSALIDGAFAHCEVRVPDDVLILLDSIVKSFDQRRMSWAKDQGRHEEHQASERSLPQFVRVVAAHALLQGRYDLRIDDLHCLKLAVPVVGPPEQAQLFTESFNNVMKFGTNNAERNALQTLCHLAELVERVREGEVLRKLNFFERLRSHFGWTSEQAVSFDEIAQAVRKLNLGLPYAEEYRKDLLVHIDHLMAQGKAEHHAPFTRES